MQRIGGEKGGDKVNCDIYGDASDKIMTIIFIGKVSLYPNTFTVINYNVLYCLMPALAVPNGIPM